MTTSVPDTATLRTTNPRLPRLLVSCAEAGRMLGVKPYPVYRLCKSGKIPHGYIGQQVVIPVQAVYDYAAAVTA